MAIIMVPLFIKTSVTSMSNNTAQQAFFAQVKSSQTLWALQDTATQGWVIIDSENYEETDVMPLWSSAEEAQQQCVETWSNYQPAAISIAQWLEFWVEDLAEDHVMIVINWQPESPENNELELTEFSQQLAEVEAY